MVGLRTWLESSDLFILLFKHVHSFANLLCKTSFANLSADLQIWVQKVPIYSVLIFTHYAANPKITRKHKPFFFNKIKSISGWTIYTRNLVKLTVKKILNILRLQGISSIIWLYRSIFNRQSAIRKQIHSIIGCINIGQTFSFPLNYSHLYLIHIFFKEQQQKWNEFYITFN